MSKQKTKQEIFSNMNYIERTKRLQEAPKLGIGLIIWTVLKLFGGGLLLLCELSLVILTCGDLQTALREGRTGFAAILQLLNIFSAAGLGIYVMSDAARRNRLKISMQMKKDAFRRIVKKYIWKLRVLFNKKAMLSQRLGYAGQAEEKTDKVSEWPKDEMEQVFCVRISSGRLDSPGNFLDKDKKHMSCF